LNDAQHLAEGSYGRQNRESIAARETQIAEGLRAIERAYHQAVEPPLAPEHRRIVPCTGPGAGDGIAHARS